MHDIFLLKILSRIFEKFLKWETWTLKLSLPSWLFRFLRECSAIPENMWAKSEMVSMKFCSFSYSNYYNRTVVVIFLHWTKETHFSETQPTNNNLPRILLQYLGRWFLQRSHANLAEMTGKCYSKYYSRKSIGDPYELLNTEDSVSAM